eukprot:TRINITY_DN3961_c0_g1_i1.p1 TRINITY_DN3961_c0_g1~~TRINITY_DN3961_c0_g1_i1.p1  ORF type:complete len:691 (+),score=206.01 TRINITY_DN3961_c0_g1_i1:78-2150(+)
MSVVEGFEVATGIDDVPSQQEVEFAPVVEDVVAEEGLGQRTRQRRRYDTEEVEDDAVEADEGVEGEGVRPQQRRGIRNLYFVRMPRPETRGIERVKIDGIQAEFDSLQMQFDMLIQTRRVTRAKKAEARDKTSKAFNFMLQTQTERKAKQDELEPYKRDQQGMNARMGDLRNQMSGLLASSEEELDQKIKQLTFQLEHDINTLQQEKSIMAQIKALQKQRPRVKQQSETKVQMDQTKQDREKTKATTKDLQQELAVLKEEESQARSIFVQFQQAEDQINKQLDSLTVERDELQKQRDAKRDELNACWKVFKEKGNMFGANREFSKKVRQMVADGDIETAKQECAKQMDDEIQRLKTDKAHRKEYLWLWSQQRATPEFVGDDLEKALAEDRKKDQKLKENAQKEQAMKKQEENRAKRAQQVVQEVLEKADKELQEASERSRKLEDARAKNRRDAEGAKLILTDDGEAGEAAGAAAPAAEAAPPADDAFGGFKQPKKKGGNKTVEVPDFSTVEEFIPPTVVRDEKPKMSDWEMKEKLREENRQKELEAERRKEQKKRAAEKKKEKALRQKQEREAAAAAEAAEQASAEQAALLKEQEPVANEEVKEEVGEQEVKEEVTTGGGKKGGKGKVKGKGKGKGGKSFGPVAYVPQRKDKSVWKKVKTFTDDPQFVMVVGFGSLGFMLLALMLVYLSK